MKLTSTAEPVMRIGMGSESNFKIKRTAKAFKVLSSSLYKDKVGAIVRELSTNAYDAHVMMGRGDRPFEIHLPKELAAHWGIRDFGPGISHEGMDELYTTYFESDKTETNDLIGGFGLGSKSPFSYTKTFVVISRFEGMKRTYDCFIDSDGMPAISCRHSEPTTEESGLEVIVPVHRNSDFAEFANRAKTNYLYYPVAPIVVSHDDFEFRELPTPIIKGEGFSVSSTSSNRRGQTGPARIIMGVVAYPISAAGLMGSRLDDMREDHPLYYATRNMAQNGGFLDPRILQHGYGSLSGRTKMKKEDKAEVELMSMCSLPIDIHMPVGSIEVVAGREDISYEEETIDLLRAKLREVHDEILQQITRQFGKAQTLLDAHKAFHDLFSDRTLSAIMADQPEVKWRGRKITSATQLLNYTDLPDLEIFHYTDDHQNQVIVKKLERFATTWNQHEDYFEGHAHMSNRIQFPAAKSDDVEFFWRDGADKAAHARVNRYRESLRGDSDDQARMVYVFQTKDDATRKAIAKQLDGYTIRHVNELPETDEAYAPPRRAPVQVLKVENVTLGEPLQTTYYDGWEQVTINVERGGIYALTDHHKIVKGSKVMQSEFSDLFNAVRYLGLVDDGGMPPIYAIPKSEIRLIDGNDKWVSVWDFLTPILRSHLEANPMVAKKAAYARSRNNMIATRPDVVVLMKVLGEVSKDITPDHAMAKFVGEFEKQNKVGKVYDHIHRAMDALDIVVEPALPPLIAEWEALTGTYPLFKLVFSTKAEYTKDKTHVRDIAHYINAVDAYEARPQQEIAA